MGAVRKSENGAEGKHSNVAYEMTCANGTDDPVKTEEDSGESPGKEEKGVREVKRKFHSVRISKKSRNLSQQSLGSSKVE